MTVIHAPVPTPENHTPSPERGGGVYYPYPSKLAEKVRIAEGVDFKVDEWHVAGVDLGEALSAIKEPILEIGGPTEEGFYFLDKQALPSRPIISNNSFEYLTDAKINQIDLMIDGRDLPFADNSLGMVISAHITKHDTESRSRTPLIDPDEYRKIADFNLAEANSAMKRVAETQVVDDEALKASVRLAIAKEVFAKLVEGGFYMTDGNEDEIKAYKAIGFDMIAYIEEGSLGPLFGSYTQDYYMVLQKTMHHQG